MSLLFVCTLSSRSASLCTGTLLSTGSIEIHRVSGCFFCSFSIFCIICTRLCMVTGIFDNLIDVLHLRSFTGSPLWYSVPFASLASVVAYRTGHLSFGCPATVSARFECCELGFASHLAQQLSCQMCWLWVTRPASSPA